MEKKNKELEKYKKAFKEALVYTKHNYCEWACTGNQDGDCKGKYYCPTCEIIKYLEDIFKDCLKEEK